MSPTSHLPELDLLRRQVADLARELAERDRVLHERTRHLHVAQALAHLGSWNWDIASGEVEWSDELYRIFGYAPRSREMTFDSFVSAVLPDDHDRVLASIDDALAGAVPYDLECRIVRPDGEVRTIHCCGEVVRDGSGQPLRMSGTALDITDRKQTELTLQQREAHFRALIEHSSDIITVLTLDGTIRFESPSIERLLGYAQHELNGRSAFEFVHHEDLPAVAEKFRLLIERPGASQLTEFRFRHKDGSWRNFEGIGRVLRDPDGRCSVIVNSRDITERKRTEAMLRISQEKLRQALQASGTGLWDWNTETNEVVLSDEWKCQLGYESTEMSDSFETWTTHLHPDDHDRAVSYVRDYISQREGDYRQEFRMRHKDGTYRWIEARASFVAETDGRTIRLLGSHTDITDRKRMEESVRESEERYRTLVELSPSGVFVFSEGRIGYVNHTGAVLMGAKDAQEILDRPTFEFIHPDYHQEVRENVKRLLSGGVSVHSAERIYLKMDGTPIPVQIEAAPITWNGKPAILGLFCDITERKRAEGALRASEELGRGILNSLSAHIAVLNHKGVIVAINDAWGRFARANGMAPAFHTGIGMNYVGSCRQAAQEDASIKRMLDGIEEVRMGRRRTFTLEYPCHSPTEQRWFLLSATALAGDEEGVVVAHEDITDRKRGEEALRASEERFRRLVEEAPLGITVLDREKRYVKVNQTFCQLLGFAAEELLGQTYAHFTHPDDLAKNLALTNEMHAGRRQGYRIEKRYVRKDGRAIWVVVNATRLTLAEATDHFMVAIIEDITDRKRAEEALWKSRHAIRALHDISSAQGQSFKERVEALLQLGCRFFDLPIGMETFVRGDELEVGQVNAPGMAFHPGMRVSLSRAYCSEPLRQSGAVCFEHAGASPEWQRHPAYAALKLESYIGTAINGLERTYGTLCFASVEPRNKPFTDSERDFIQLMARWLGGELDRQSALDALRQSEERYRTLYDETPSMYFTVDGTGITRSVNQYGAQYLGYRVEDLVGKSVATIFFEEDRARVCAEMAAFFRQPKGIAQWKFRKVRRDGAVLWVRELAHVLQSQEGESLALIVCEDITKHKQSEEALRTSEERYMRATAIGRVGVWELDVLTGQYHGDANLKALFGYAPEELSTDPYAWLNVVHPNDQPIAMKNWELVQSGAADASHYELRHIKKDGSVVWGDVRAHAVRNRDGQLTHLIGATVDITERKQAELALRESEERFSKAFRASLHPIGITEVMTGRCIEVNEACLELFGFRREEVIGNTTLMLGIWPNIEDRARLIARLKAGEPVRNMEFALKAKSGRLRYLLASCDLVELNGTLCLITVGSDITERKQTEEALRISEERFAKAFRASPHPVVISELDSGRVVDANDAAYQLYGYRKEEVVGHTTLQIGIWHSAEERTRYLDLLKRDGSVRNVEVTLRNKSGEVRQCLLSSELIELNGKQCSVTVGDDITESKRMERALKRTQFSVDQAVEAILWVDQTGRIFNVNETACRMLGYTRQDLTTITVHDIDPNFPVERWPEHWSHVKEQGAMAFEAKFWSRTGGVLETDVTVNYLQYEGKEYGCMILRDIGERKRAEAERRRSHTFLRQVIDTDPDLIFAKDREGRFTMANKAVADWYGTTVENLIGKSDADFHNIAEEVAFFRQSDLEVFHSRRDQFTPEERITDAGGRTRWLQTVKRPIFDDQGRVHMVLGAATDITERKRMEEILLQRERDLSAALQERERISQDLHDGILQSLYAVGLGLEACKPLIKKQDRAAEKFMTTLDQAIGQLNQVMTEIRNFIAGLESQVMQGGDFSTALRTMVETMSISASARCRVRIDDAAARRLSTEQALHIINIVREGLSNALRHSRAKQITVSLRDLIRSDRLAVTDDGVGFNTRSVQGVGHGLVNMAARAQKVRGLFVIQSKPDKGTRISLDLPKDAHYAHN